MTSPVQSTLGRKLEYCIGHAHSPRRADEERAPVSRRARLPGDAAKGASNSSWTTNFPSS